MWRCDPKLKVTVKRFMQGSVACEVRECWSHSCSSVTVHTSGVCVPCPDAVCSAAVKDVFAGGVPQRGCGAAPRQQPKPVCSCALQRFSQESLDFQERISQRSGLGDGTACLPPALHILPKPIITMQVRGCAEPLQTAVSDCPTRLEMQSRTLCCRRHGMRPSRSCSRRSSVLCDARVSAHHDLGARSPPKQLRRRVQRRVDVLIFRGWLFALDSQC